MRIVYVIQFVFISLPICIYAFLFTFLPIKDWPLPQRCPPFFVGIIVVATS